MAIPISYNLRNMRQRKSATLMTALGIALTVTTAIFLMSLLAGLDEAFRTSGDPQNVLCLRKGSNAELSSGIPHESAAILKTLPGVARDAQGQQMASGEIVMSASGQGKVLDLNLLTEIAVVQILDGLEEIEFPARELRIEAWLPRGSLADLVVRRGAEGFVDEVQVEDDTRWRDVPRHGPAQ